MKKEDNQSTRFLVFELNRKPFCNIKVCNGMITEANVEGFSGIKKIVKKGKVEPFKVYSLDAWEKNRIGHFANCKLIMKEEYGKEFLYLNLSEEDKKQLNWIDMALIMGGFGSIAALRL